MASPKEMMKVLNSALMWVDDWEFYLESSSLHQIRKNQHVSKHHSMQYRP